MKKSGLIALIVVLTMGLAVSSFAVVKKKGSGRGVCGGMASCDGYCGCDGPRMEKLKALGLDDKQMETIRAIHLRTQKEMVRKGADAKVAEIELKEILSQDTVDMKAAEAAVKKREGLKSEMKMLHIRAMEEIKSNLNPEQKKKFIALMGMGMMGSHGDAGKKCNMQGMGGMMGDMDSMHDADTPPMKHRHH